ncbi:MAG: fused MFS/spermidine synthase [Planctomycetota bacterium]
MHMAFLLFLSSLLLFLVQPILGKALLPEWGGGANVWTACLLFFQLGLLIGYLYAYASAKWLTTRAQLAFHLLLIGLSLLWLPLQGTARIAWLSKMDAWNLDPAWQILGALSLSVGLPYVLMSSTTPLLSHWSFQSAKHSEPYRWYSWSSLGSLLGCLLYPFLIEPRIGLHAQELIWTIAYVTLCLGLAAYVVLFYRTSLIVTSSDADRATIPTVRLQRPLSARLEPSPPFPFLTWVGLSACSSIVLSASTSNASQAGIIVPGIWVLPLAMYLMSWWFAFGSPRLERWSSHMLLFFTGGAFALVLLIFKLWLPWVAIVLGYVIVVALISLACHNLLYVVRPTPEKLTAFYLAIALGGALGSAFVSLVAPAVFDDYWELHVGLILGALLFASHYSWRLFPEIANDAWVRRFQWPVTLLASLLLIGTLLMHANIQSLEKLVQRRRDFYGLVSVVEHPKEGHRTMLHGQTRHGAEPLDGPLHPDRTMYYQSNSGAALAWGWAHDHMPGPLRVGVIGLGTGSLSLFAHANDHMIYYEISPAVTAMAQQHFHYLQSHTGTTEVRLGDGRRRLFQEVTDAEEVPLDLLIVDAFSNDSLPMHLLTVEALRLYQRRLNDRGLIAMNITNRNLDLAPVLFAAAKEVGLQPLLVESPLSRDATSTSPSSMRSRIVRWLLLFPRDVELPPWPNARGELRPSESASIVEPWTDDFGSPFHALRWAR